MPATTTTTTTTPTKLKQTRNRKPGAKVYRQADGRWLIRYKYTDRRTGKAVDIKRTARGRTKTEALTEARALEREAIDAATRDLAMPKETPTVPTIAEFLPLFLDTAKAKGAVVDHPRNFVCLSGGIDVDNLAALLVIHDPALVAFVLDRRPEARSVDELDALLPAPVLLVRENPEIGADAGAEEDFSW